MNATFSKQISIQKSMVTNQHDAVKWHLQEYGKISSWEAIKEYGITRLSSIIFNLRKQGYMIVSHEKSFTNRFGRNCTYAEYVYANLSKN